MKHRNLLNGTEVEELDENITLKVYTKCPSKYKLIDMETGEEYVGQDPRRNNYHWSKINA
jgi:hypothetical protein